MLKQVIFDQAKSYTKPKIDFDFRENSNKSTLCNTCLSVPNKVHIMCQTACIRNDKPLMKFLNAILVQNLAVVNFLQKAI